MIRQSVKDSYYFFLSHISWLLKLIYKVDYRISKSHIKKVQIGCGVNYLESFINIDGNFQRRVDYLLDARAGLPFPNDSIEIIYSCHMFEHLYIEDAIALLRDCHRVLSSTGYMRLTLPDFNFIHKILNGEVRVDFPRKFMSKSGMAINYLFCDGQHRFAYTKEVIDELAFKIGFRVVEVKSSKDANISNDDLKEPEGSVTVNLYK